MMTATPVYTYLRPSTSAIRPKMTAPKNAPKMAEPVTQLVSRVLRCHWTATMVDTVLMTKRSYESVKNPTPDTRTVRRWNLLLGASLRRSLTDGDPAAGADSPRSANKLDVTHNPFPALLDRVTSLSRLKVDARNSKSERRVNESKTLGKRCG